MANSDASNDADLNAITINYISSDNKTSPVLPPIINSYYEDNGYWVFSSHDIPILIGAAAGAIGLIIIFLAAALIWHCCQFALQREKSSYSLDNDSERNSVSSQGSNLYMNNPESSIIAEEKSVLNENCDQNMKRSISAPLTRDNFALQNNTQIPVIKSQGMTQTNRPYSNVFACNDSLMIKNVGEKINPNHEHSIAMELNEKEDINEMNQHRSYVYEPNHNINSDVTLLKSRSLPWAQSNKKRPVNSGDDLGELTAKVNYSKKRKNRMRNDSAAAIAMNRSGTNPTNKLTFAHKDTDTLVDNEAVVVYDERTAL